VENQGCGAMSPRTIECFTCSAGDIALQCGFTDHAHLSKHFRQVMGQTPAAWRRVHRSHHDEHGTPPKEHDPRVTAVFQWTAVALSCSRGVPLKM
jgi:AraC-like DNA-binding protein